jgi:hypothetical protein
MQGLLCAHHVVRLLQPHMEVTAIGSASAACNGVVPVLSAGAAAGLRIPQTLTLLLFVCTHHPLIMNVNPASEASLAGRLPCIRTVRLYLCGSLEERNPN